MKKSLVDKSLVLMLIIIALLIPEWVARVWFPEWAPRGDASAIWAPDQYTGWLHQPNKTMTFWDKTFTTNSAGLRSPEIKEKVRPRILFLGDSFLWGFGVSNHERYMERLQEKIPSHEMINAGISGWGTLQEYLFLKHYGLKFQPDIVVVHIYNNDFGDNLEETLTYDRPHYDWKNGFVIANYPVAKQAVYERAAVYLVNNTYFYRQMLLRAFGFLSNIYSDPKSEIEPEWRNGFPFEYQAEAMKISLRKIIELCRVSGIEVIFFGTGIREIENKPITEVMREFGTPYYLLNDSVNEDANPILLEGNLHWNALGHQMLADALYPHIQARIGAISQARDPD